MQQARVLLAGIVCLVALAGCSHIPKEAVCKLNIGDGQGSGTLIGVAGDQGLVLTCRHLARGVGYKVKATWPATGEITEGQVLAVRSGPSYDTDQALVMVKRPAGIEPAEVAKFDPNNYPFTSVGYRGKDFYVSVAQTGDNEIHGIGVIKLSAPYIGGMSGGGCFDCYGRLVGINVASPDPETGRGHFAIASDGPELHTFLETYLK